MSPTNLRAVSFVRASSQFFRQQPAFGHIANRGEHAASDAHRQISSRGIGPVSIGGHLPLASQVAGSDPLPAASPTPLFVAFIQAADVLIVLASGVIASRVCWALSMAGTGQPGVITLAVVVASMFALTQIAAIDTRQPRDFGRRTRASVLALGVGCAASVVWCLTLPDATAALCAGPMVWGLVASGIAVALVAFSIPVRRLPQNQGRLARRVAVVGVNDYSQAFIDRLKGDKTQSATFIGLYDDATECLGASPSDARVLGKLSDLVARSRRERIDAIVLALPLSNHDRIVRSRAELGSVIADIYIAADVLDLTCKAGLVDRLGSNPVIKIGSRPLTEWQVLQKSTMDWLLSAALLVATLPFLALIALAIRFDSPGPVLFRQPRLGFNNGMFKVFKFRTMYHHMTDVHADRQTTRGDPRITRVGRLLRKTSLDEVPQLLNVLRGEMSLVGPRPHAANTKAGDHLFHDVVADYASRHRVKPGITGWAQVNGWRGETRTAEQLEQRVAHDLHYIDNWSLPLDLKIIVLTVTRELNSKVAF